MRYLFNDQYFDPNTGGPVFLMIGGEGEAPVEWMTGGSWVDDAEKHGALLLQLEHRYYGKSHPTEDMSTENLKYLTSQQALADLATFITAMNKNYSLPSDVKWIAFGGSYPGSLAAWLRFKYPHLVHGAVSSSSPLLAKVDFSNYFKVVRESLAAYSDDCVAAVQQGVREIGTLLKDEGGRKNLNKIFNLCTPIQESLEKPLDISNFYEMIADNFGEVVQENGANRNSSQANANITIDAVCEILVNQTIGSHVNRLGKVNDLLLITRDEKCMDYQYEKMIDSLRNVSWDSEEDEGDRQWMYQLCTEFGFFTTSSNESHIFGDKFPTSFFIQQCKDIFGDSYDEDFIDGAVDHTNMLYGGFDIEVSNVVYVYGSIDPWHALGITKTLDKKAPAIYIEGTAHCVDLYSPADTDSAQLTAARQKVSQLIESWLKL
ncbi:putative serine protease K12H4.7 isoform X2 [Zophobas morio]|uniref:putative serine protease K12H4.7 isoform X2 n=1 Tax=Zophobas morio TaxID=2755281 RepID=UPI00308314B2